MTASAHSARQPPHRHAVLRFAQLLVESNQLRRDGGGDLSFVLFMACDLGIDLAPGCGDHLFESGDLGTGRAQLGVEAADLRSNRVDLIDQPEHSILECALLTPQRLHLETLLLGLAAAHATRVQARLGLFELDLDDFELAFGFVEIELEAPEGAASLRPDRFEPLTTTGRLLIRGQLGQSLTLMDQPIDVQVDILQVEEIGEAQSAETLGQGPSILLPRCGVFGEVDHIGQDRAGH